MASGIWRVRIDAGISGKARDGHLQPCHAESWTVQSNDFGRQRGQKMLDRGFRPPRLC